jgi:hypothetical protein
LTISVGIVFKVFAVITMHTGDFDSCAHVERIPRRRDVVPASD